MKKLVYTAFLAIVALTMLDSCMGKNVYDEYKDWRQLNEEWYANQAQSGQYYVAIAPWDPSAQVLMLWHNDTMQTRFNLKPLISSTVDVIYKLRLYNGTAVDSSYISGVADSTYRSVVRDNVEGWMIALTRMHVGDSCTVIVPYQQGYGANKKSATLVPFSNLVFDMKLVDIYKYKVN